MREICQDSLPVKPWMEEKLRRMPGMQPLAPEDWLQVDEAYGPQMAYRDELLAGKRDEVYRIEPAAAPAAEELLHQVLRDIDEKPGFEVHPDQVIRPDGVAVELGAAPPLVTAARLVQEDFAILEKRGTEHVLTGIALCFPSSWSIAEKFGHGLVFIHDPVPHYDADIAPRIQRMFDKIRVEQPMWRANYLVYSDPDLHQPRSASRRRSVSRDALWVRSERQTLIKLPKTGAVVFGIHTYVVRPDCLSEAEWQAFVALRLDRESHMYGARIGD